MASSRTVKSWPRGRSSSSTTPLAAKSKSGSIKISQHRKGRSGYGVSTKQLRRKTAYYNLRSSQVKTSGSGVKASRTVARVKGHHKIVVTKRAPFEKSSSTKSSVRRPRASARLKLRKSPPFPELPPQDSSLSRVAYFLRSSSSLAGPKLSKNTGSSTQNVNHSKDSALLIERKRRLELPHPPPPPNTPCTPETPTPPRKWARLLPVLKAKSTGKKSRPRSVRPSRSGVKRRRTEAGLIIEDNLPAKKRKRRHDNILTDLKSRLDAIRSGKRDGVAMPTARPRHRKTPGAVSKPVSIIVIARKLKRRLAETTRNICEMNLRNGKVKISQL